MPLDFKGRVALTLLARGAALGLGLVSSVLTARGASTGVAPRRSMRS